MSKSEAGTGGRCRSKGQAWCNGSACVRPSCCRGVLALGRTLSAPLAPSPMIFLPCEVDAISIHVLQGEVEPVRRCIT